MKFIIYYFYLKWLFNPTDLITTLSINNVKRIFYGIHARDADFKGRSAYTLEELEVLYGIFDSKLTNFTIQMQALVRTNRKIRLTTLNTILTEVNTQLPCLNVNRFFLKEIPTATFTGNNLTTVLHPGNRLYRMLTDIGICDNDLIEFYALVAIITTILTNAIHVHTNLYNRWILVARVIHRIINSIETLERLHFTLFKRNVNWIKNEVSECETSDTGNVQSFKSMDYATDGNMGIKSPPLEHNLCTGIGVVKVVDTVLDVENQKEPVIKSGVMSV